MIVSQTNMFVTGRVIIFNDGTQKLVRDKLKIQSAITDEFYTVLAGDMLDEIAYRKWKDKVDKAWLYWWIIADINKILNPLDISDFVGREIIVPDIQRVLLLL